MRAKRQVRPPGQTYVRVKGAGHREPKILFAGAGQAMDSTKTLRQQVIAQQLLTRLRELCEERGLGFDELAAEIGVEPGVLEEIGRAASARSTP